MKKYKVNKGNIIQKLDKKTVIFDGEKSVLFTFNETGSYIFDQIKRGKSKKEIAASLVKRYGIKEEGAEKDVKDTINDLLMKNIVKKRDERLITLALSVIEVYHLYQERSDKIYLYRKV